MRRWTLCTLMTLCLAEPLVAAEQGDPSDVPPDPALLEMLGQSVALEAMGVPMNDLVEERLDDDSASGSNEARR